MTDFNAADRDVSRAIRSWLHEDRHEDASRVAGAVLDQIEATPGRRTTWWPARRTQAMNRIVGFGLVAAAAVVALVVGLQLLSSPGANIGGPGVEPTATSIGEPTPEPSALPSAQGGLPEGPFLIGSGLDDDGETLHPPLTVTIPAPGWRGDEGGGILLKDWVGADGDAGMIIFAQPEYVVFDDPCSWASTPGTTVTTVDEFVAALAAQPTRDASEPVDVTVGGYPGKSITLHMPDDLDVSECDEGIFGTWNCGDPGDPIACGFNDGAGETSTEYIFDVDGVIMAWHVDYEVGAPPDAAAELEAIVQSATFGE
jgi:hypothetical protein